MSSGVNEPCSLSRAFVRMLVLFCFVIVFMLFVASGDVLVVRGGMVVEDTDIEECTFEVTFPENISSDIQPCNILPDCRGTCESFTCGWLQLVMDLTTRRVQNNDNVLLTSSGQGGQEKWHDMVHISLYDSMRLLIQLVGGGYYLGEAPSLGENTRAISYVRGHHIDHPRTQDIKYVIHFT